MKRRLVLSFLIIGVVSALVGGATFAYFSDAGTSSGNTFAAGTLNVTVGNQQYSVPINNIAPGDTISGQFTVTNAGTLELRYSTTAATSGDLFGGTTPATVTFTGGQDGVLAPGQSATVTYMVSLPGGAGNWYQGKQGSLTFNVSAEQTANNP